MKKRLWTGIVVLGIVLFPQHVAAAENAVPLPTASGSVSAPRSAPEPSAIRTKSEIAGSLKRADFARERASRDARHVADWVVDSGDNRGMPFVIVDKMDAKVFVFDAGGRILGAAPALLGSARGDDSFPGIGDREYSDMRPEERTTPAGRFVAVLGRNFRGEDIVWVDYEAAVSLHRVITTNPQERRLERLATPTPLDNRISYGCINVPARFYETVVRPAFTGTDGIVYVLPEARSVREVFGSYDVEERARRHYTAQPPAVDAPIAGSVARQ